MRVLCFILSISLFSLSAAHADSSTVKSAKEHFRAGSVAFNLGHYEEAVKEYELAYRLKNDPVLLYNIAQAYRVWGKNAEAVRAYKVYLTNAPDAPNRAEVTAKIDALESAIEEQRRAEAPPPEQPRTPEPAPNHARAEAPVRPAPVAAVPTPGADRERARRGRIEQIAGIATGVVGLGLVGGGIGLELLAKSAGDSIGAASRSGGVFDPGKESTGHTDQILGGVFIGVGAAAVATGVVLIVLGRHHRAVETRTASLANGVTF